MTRRRCPSMPTLDLGGFVLGRPGSDRQPEDAVASVAVEQAGTVTLVDLTEADLVEVRDWINEYVDRLHAAP
jgi:hypothetical protein